VKAKQNKEFIRCFPSAGRCSAVSRKARIHQAQWLLGKTNAITPNISPFLLLPPTLYAEYDLKWHGTSLWSGGVSCPGRVPSQLLVHPQPPYWWGGVRSRKGLDSVQALLSSN